MKVMMRWMLAMVLAVTGLAQGQAHAVLYSTMYVFGDSLVDSGNAFIGTGGAQANPADGYFEGRFSNGLNFADYLGMAVTRKPVIPFLMGGNNLAVGGALAETRAGETSPSFLAQLGRFTMSSPTIASDALVLVTFGGNDVRATAGIAGTVDFGNAIADLDTGLSQLYELGARNFVITGVPDIGKLPSAQPLGAIPNRLAELTSRSQQLNGLIGTEAASIDRKNDTNVAFFDLFTFQRDVLADPAAFGLPSTLDSTTPCQIVGGGSPQLTNCANALYFDGIHPTTQIHRAIANSIVTQLPEPATWLAMVVGFGIVGGSLRRRTAIAVRLA